MFCTNCGREFRDDGHKNCPACRKSRSDWHFRNRERELKRMSDWAKKNPEKAQQKNRRRQAKKLNVPHDDWIWYEIYARDLGVCQICGLPVYNDDLAPIQIHAEYDHRVPLSKGGSDTADNVWLTHRFCNQHKHNKWLHEVDVEFCRREVKKQIKIFTENLMKL